MQIVDGSQKTENKKGYQAGRIGFDQHHRMHTVYPHHGSGGVSHNRACTTGIGCGYDGCDETNVHVLPEDDDGNGATDHGSGNIVQEG